VANILDDYFAALERLRKGRPNVVPKGTKITNDAVALEAGRGKGSIKKSRRIFSDLVEAINQAAAEQSRPRDEIKDRLNVVKHDVQKYRSLWEEALAREVSLLNELYATKQMLASLTGENVLPFLRGTPPKDQTTKKAGE